MAPEPVQDDGGDNQNPVFIDTSLGTHLATIVSDSDTVSDLKQKIMLEHRQFYPDIGDIRIKWLKVKKRGIFYPLSNSMRIKTAFWGVKKNWYVSVDVSRLEQDGGTQHMVKNTVGDQLALPWLTDSRSIDEQPYAVNEQIGSKKRTREMHNESSFVKKKRKIEKLEGNVNVSHENVVIRVDTDKVKDTEASISNQNSLEHKLKSKDLSDENMIINKDENFSVLDQVETAVLPAVEGVGEGSCSRKNTEANENVSVVAMVVDNNIVQEMPVVATSQKEKNDELVHKEVTENEIPSSPIMTVLEGSKNKAAENEVSSTSSIKKLHNTNADANDSLQHDVASIGQQSASNRIKEHKKDKGDGKKKKSKKTVTKEKDESLVKNTDNIVGNMTSAVPDPVPVLDEKINDQRYNDNVTAERNEVSEKTVVADHHVGPTVLVNKDHNINNNDAIDLSQKDVGPTLPESVGEQIDKHKKGKKRKSKRSVAKNSDGLLVGPTSSTIPAPGLNEKVIDEKNEDRVGLIYDDRIDVSEIACNHDSLVVAVKESDVAVNVVEVKKIKDVKKSSKKKKDESLVKHADNFVCDASSIPAPVLDEKNDEKTFEDDSLVKNANKSDITVKVVEISKPTETVEENLPKVVKDIGRSKKKKKDVVKHKEVATVTNEENVLPPPEKKASVEIALHGENGRNDDINADVRISGDEKRENQVNDEGVNDDKLEKPNEKMNDCTKKSRKKKTAKKSAGRNENESSKPHSPEPKNGPENVGSVELHHLPEEAVKNVNVSEVSKVQMEQNHDNVINEVDIPNDKSNEIDFKNYFVSGDQQNKPKKKTKEPTVVETSIDNKQQNREQDGITTQSQKSCLINETHKVSADVAKESKVQNIINVMKNPTKTRKVDTSKKGHNGPSAAAAESRSTSESFRNQKTNKPILVSGQTQVKTVKKNPLVVNSSQNVKKSLLNTPGNIFGNDTDESGSNDDNSAVNSDSSTRTPSRNAPSSSEESASSIDSRRKGSCAVKRKEIGGKNTLSSQSRPKNTSINDLLRSSSRFKKARLTASKQVENTESQPVDFVPESQPI